MTPLARNPVDPGPGTTSDPGRSLALATGMEAGVFGGDTTTFPPTCARTCLSTSEGSGVAGGCSLVRGLVEGSVPEGDRGIRL